MDALEHEDKTNKESLLVQIWQILEQSSSWKNFHACVNEKGEISWLVSQASAGFLSTLYIVPANAAPQTEIQTVHGNSATALAYLPFSIFALEPEQRDNIIAFCDELSFQLHKQNVRVSIDDETSRVVISVFSLTPQNVDQSLLYLLHALDFFSPMLLQLALGSTKKRARAAAITCALDFVVQCEKPKSNLAPHPFYSAFKFADFIAKRKEENHGIVSQ